VPDQFKHHQFRGLLSLSLIWLVGAVGDRIWFALDHSVPAWDQAEYLTGSLNYWQALQHPQWFSSEWWKSFWMISAKVPPLTFIVTAIVQNIFGTGPDQATLVNLLFSGILLGSVYGLGVQLFSVEVGLWAAGLCQILPALYRLRLDFLLDYPLTAAVTLSFWCMTVWKAKGEGAGGAGEDSIYIYPSSFILHPSSFQGWFWAAAFGLSFGLALLVKQTALFFLLVPVLWVGVEAIRKRDWRRISQLVVALLLSVAVFGPWYRTNWLLIITGGKRATVDAAIAEGDPPLNTLAAWTYYWELLPYQVSWLLLLVPIVGLLFYWKRQRIKIEQNPSPHSSRSRLRVYVPRHSPLAWLAVFLLGSYLLCSLNINKDDRYVLPYLPVVSLFLAYGLTRWSGRWGNRIRWGTAGLAVLLMFFNLFPIGGVLGNGITQLLSPNAQYHAYLKPELPHTQIVDEIIQTEPYISSTLGVLPSTPEINQHNFNYYGALHDFQVYARQVGTQKKQIFQDARSLDWFLTKTGNQGSVPAAQAGIVQIVEQGGDFQLHKTWSLPDSSILKLYHHHQPSIQVKPIVGVRGQGSGVRGQERDRIALLRVIVPQQAPPGVPVPVAYEWTGSWEQLQPGLVLLTWKNQAVPTSHHRWLHDHGIGRGTLHSRRVSAEPSTTEFRVIEQMAMLPPADIPSGTYTLEATYLNRKTGETYPISVPPVTLKIDPVATATPAPELDLLTQHRILAATLLQGREALDRVFAEVGRINQYDPIQDYLVQMQLAMEYRLQREPQNRDWAYALALSQVLQQHVQGAIAALERVTQLDSQNPYAYAYLAFVHLYNWDGAAAETALKPALALNPNQPELQALNGIATLMQGNLIKAWHDLSSLRNSLAPRPSPLAPS